MSAAGALGLALFAAAAISRSITRLLQQATEVARRIQAGDLRTRIRSQGRDETAHGNAELSMRTERSASNLQQTATAVEQISTTAAGSSAKSHQASKVAGRAREAVMHGGMPWTSWSRP